MSNQPALVPSDRDSRRRVRVSRTRRGPPDAPDRMNGMMTPWSDGTPMKPTCADRAERSSTGGAPKKVLVAGRMNVPRGPSASAIVVTLPRNVAAPIRDLPNASTSWYKLPPCGRKARSPRRSTTRWVGSGGETNEATAPAVALPRVRCLPRRGLYGRCQPESGRAKPGHERITKRGRLADHCAHEPDQARHCHGLRG